jgi:hypothetical protein
MRSDLSGLVMVAKLVASPHRPIEAPAKAGRPFTRVHQHAEFFDFWKCPATALSKS